MYIKGIDFNNLLKLNSIKTSGQYFSGSRSEALFTSDKYRVLSCNCGNFRSKLDIFNNYHGKFCLNFRRVSISRIHTTSSRHLNVSVRRCNLALSEDSPSTNQSLSIHPSDHSSPPSSLDTPVTDGFESNVYVNTVCMEMDRLLYKSKNYDELLTLLVTHRGVLYLYNLVTAMKILATFVKDDVQPDVDVEDLYAGYNEIKGDKIGLPGSDPRELEGEVNREAPCNGNERTSSITESHNNPLDVQNFGIVSSSDRVFTKTESDVLNYEKLNAFMNVKFKKPNRKLSEVLINDDRYKLLIQDLCMNRSKLDCISACGVIISLDEIGHRCYPLYNGLLKQLLDIDVRGYNKVLIQVCQCYIRAGYDNIPLYNKIMGIDGIIDNDTIPDIIRLYGNTNSYDYSLNSKLYNTVYSLNYNPNNISWISVAFSTHQVYNFLNDDIMFRISDYININYSKFNLRELCRCILSFCKMKLYFKNSWHLCARRLTDELFKSINEFYTIDLNIYELSRVIKDLTSFNPSDEIIRKLVDVSLIYLEDHIDDLNEDSSINFAIATCLTDKFDSNGYMLSYLWRKIGSGTEWEKYKFEVFNLWLYQVLNFPKFKYNIKKICIIGSMREWMLKYHAVSMGQSCYDVIRNEKHQKLIGIDLIFKDTCEKLNEIINMGEVGKIK